MITVENIKNALKQVIDPDLGKDIVSLRMVEDVRVQDDKVQITLVLTTPACPLKEHLESECYRVLKANFGADVKFDIHITSRTTSRRNDNEQLLPGVKNILCVASGKGGVGKSTVAVNLAIALHQEGASVGLIDADVYGPSIPLMTGLKGVRPQVTAINGKHYLLPIEKFGVKFLSIGFLIEEQQAVVWRGPMVSSALRQFVTDCLWGELDYLILDLPPGTGDVHLTLVQTVPVTGAVIVTTPQPVALSDARKAIGMFRMEQVNVPVIGIVENMSWFTPPELPDRKYYLFGKGGGKQLADEFEVPLLGEIPITERIRECGDSGAPVVLDEESVSAKAFREAAKNIVRQVAIRNASLPPTKKVEITQ